MAERIKEWIGAHQFVTGGSIVVLFLCGYLLSVVLRQPDDAWLTVSFINEYNNVGRGSVLYEDFMRLNAGEGRRIVFDSGYFFDLSDENDFTNRYYQKLVAYLEAGTTDVLICEEGNLRGIARGGRVLDLSDERVAEWLSAYQERLYYYDTEEDGRIPVGISLSGSSYSEALGYEGKVYLALNSRAKHLDAVKVFLDFLFER